MTNQNQLFATRIESLVPQQNGAGTLVNTLYIKLDRLSVQLIKTQKQAAQAESDRIAMLKQNRELNDRVAMQAQIIDQLAQQIKKQTTSPGSNIPKDVWRRLLQLCHPDKHSNADAATAATQWLNANKPS